MRLTSILSMNEVDAWVECECQIRVILEIDQRHLQQHAALSDLARIRREASSGAMRLRRALALRLLSVGSRGGRGG